MPELPEVETVRRGLIASMQGQVIARADVNRPDLRWPFPQNMAARLTGATVTALRRRSKYVLVDLDTGETLIIHLGMSGRMTISRETRGDDTEGARGDGENGLGQFHHNHPGPAKHDHVVFHMAGGARVTFNDARRFGAMDLATTAALEDHWLIKTIGPEPLGNTFSEPYLIEALAHKNTPIKTALLDQRILAGLGNIYVCEVLHRARINPKRKAGKLSKTRVASLVPIVRDVLNEAIAAGGSSLKDYRQADGELGYFQHGFKAYDRMGHPCQTEGCTGTITRIVQSGRSTFYCPKCQR